MQRLYYSITVTDSSHAVVEGELDPEQTVSNKRQPDLILTSRSEFNVTARSEFNVTVRSIVNVQWRI